MRPIERIDNFLNLVDWDKLINRWELSSEDSTNLQYKLRAELYISTSPKLNESNPIIKYWKDNPDQRFGQVLINLGIISNVIFRIWLDEESDILLDQGIAPEYCLYWTSIYDKDGNLLDKPISKLLKDLDTDHIVNIYKYVYTENNKTLSDTYDLAFNNVLTKRKAYKELEEIQLICITQVNGITKKN